MKPKIVIIIPCWGRSDVFRLVSSQLDLFYYKTKTEIDLTVLYIFSPEDKELQQLDFIYHDANHVRDKIYSSNKQLGKKLNDGIEYASRFNYDYIMNMGSDDLIHPGLIDKYLPFIKANVPVMGVSSLYFLKKNEDPVFFFYYNTPHVIGAGRMIHRSAIQSVISKYGALYDPDICRGMDTHSAKRLKDCGYGQQVVYRGKFPYIVDIKSEVNINSFDQIIQPKNTDRYRTSNISVLEKEYTILQSYNS